MKLLVRAFAFSVALLLPLLSYAQTTRYVSDDLEITMRSGQGVKYSIKKMLRSGEALTVLETDPAGYSKVKTSNGIEGWVLTRYLSNSPSAREQLKSHQERIANLELEVTKYKEEIATLTDQNANAGEKNLSLKETSQRLSKELNDLRRTASNAVAIDNENRELKRTLQELDHKNQSLLIENKALKDNSGRSWFLVGAAVLVAGLLLGLIIPRLRLRKKNSWGSL